MNFKKFYINGDLRIKFDSGNLYGYWNTLMYRLQREKVKRKMKKKIENEINIAQKELDDYEGTDELYFERQKGYIEGLKKAIIIIEKE